MSDWIDDIVGSEDASRKIRTLGASSPLVLAGVIQSARAHFALAQQLKNRQMSEARTYFQTALELLPADQDPSLDDSLRQRIKDAITRELK